MQALRVIRVPNTECKKDIFPLRHMPSTGRKEDYWENKEDSAGKEDYWKNREDSAGDGHQRNGGERQRLT